MDIDAPDYLHRFPVQLASDRSVKPKPQHLSRAQHGGRPSKRRNILQFAVELAEEQGPKGFTIDALCERSDISKGGIFYHFASVSELVHEMFIYYLDTQLPQWIDADPVLAGKSSQNLSSMSVEALTYLVQHAPLNANLERLVFKVTLESPPAPPADSFLRRILAAASPNETITLYSVFGARIARVFDMPGAALNNRLQATPGHEDNESLQSPHSIA